MPKKNKIANSTESFCDLYNYEYRELQSLNAGRFQERAGPHAVSDTVCIDRHNKDTDTVTRLKADFVDRNQATLAGRNRRKYAANNHTATPDDGRKSDQLTGASASGRPRRNPRISKTSLLPRDVKGGPANGPASLSSKEHTISRKRKPARRYSNYDTESDDNTNTDGADEVGLCCACLADKANVSK